MLGKVKLSTNCNKANTKWKPEREGQGKPQEKQASQNQLVFAAYLKKY